MAVLSHNTSELVFVDENHTSLIRQNFEAYHKELGDIVCFQDIKSARHSLSRICEAYIPYTVKLIQHFSAEFDTAWLNQRSHQICLFLQSILNADCPLETSSCFQGTKRSTFIQHFPVHQEKEFELFSLYN